MCGMIGIIGPQKASYEVFGGLMTLQHRGQDGAGILTYDEELQKFHLEKKKGLVNEVFSPENLKVLPGNCSLGHNRYSTVGTGHENELQPFHTSFPFGLGMVHNGNVVNYWDLVKKLRQNHLHQVLTNNDLEVILTLFARGLAEQIGAFSTPQDAFSPSLLPKVVEKIFSEVKGGYSVIGILAGLGLFAFRDPRGIRPLVYGKKTGPEGKTYYCFSSETGALSFLGYEYVRNVKAGELLFVNLEGELMTFQVGREEARPCMFEWVYFAGSEGALEDREVYASRTRLGKYLAWKIQRDRLPSLAVDMVVPVPETSRVGALSLSAELGIPYKEVLIKNRYIHRSFILNSQEEREKAVELKLIPVKSEIAGKNILLVDDSIVRGTTAKRIVGMLKKYGAGAVHLVSTCPPILFPCFYGVDFPDQDELLAHQQKNDPQKIASAIGADSVLYLDKEDLVAALDLLQGKGPCMACLTGEYPVGVESAQTFWQQRKQHRQEKGETEKAKKQSP